MRVLRINALNEPIKFQTVEKIKITNKSDFLVKVLYSPINPSDMGFISNIYGRFKFSKFPKPLGFEGCGIIEDTNEENKFLLGKKIVFACDYESET